MSLNFDISYSGIFAGQRAIKIAQTNIANMNTVGYARQQLDLSVNTSLSGAGVSMEIGNGVIANQVVRLKDEFLISQSRGETSEVGYYQGLRQTLSSVESLFSETSEGSISKRIAGFFNAWDELSKYPEENSYRNALVASSEGLATKLNDTYKSLNEVNQQMDQNIDIQLKKVNELVQKIANVNDKIVKSANERPNSMLDERDRYLDELASLVDIEVSNDIKNPLLVNVKVGDVAVVGGVESRKIESMYDTNAKEWIITTGNTLMNFKSGSLQASLEVRNSTIPGYIKKLDDFASALLTEVNALHQSGYGLDDSTGNDFFIGTGVHNIGINPLLKANPEKLAVSSKVSTPGNSDISKAIGALKDANILSSGTANPISYYNGFAIEMATELNIVADNEIVHNNILINVEAERQQVQGVSMDEELGNLLRFEQYYAANSKVITTVNKVYETLFQMI